MASARQCWKDAFVALVRRREPRGVWFYTICAIVVVLYALGTLYGIGVEAVSPILSDFLVPALWLSVTVGVAVAQAWRQTLLAWLLLVTAFTAVAVVLGYWLIGEPPLDLWDLTLLAMATAICLGLIRYRSR
jgi:hypothetical protein